MYECLYGYTPFACDDRHQTKLKILQHKKTLVFPQLKDVPQPSIEALDLMMSMLVEKEKRLCSRQYEFNDSITKYQGGRVHRYVADKNHRDYRGYFVYPHDAEDIKRHAFFRELDWDTIHLRRPPYIPRVKGWEDTKYFQEEEPISDIDTATTVDDTDRAAGMGIETRPSHSQRTRVSQHQPEGQHIIPSAALKIPPPRYTLLPDTKCAGESLLRNPLMQPRAKEAPTTGATLVGTGGQADGQAETGETANFKPILKKKEKKRPRDIILRDPVAGPPALEARKLGAFLGYEYRQPVAAKHIIAQVLAEDQAKVKSRACRQAADDHDHDLSAERRVYLGAGGQITPQHSPVQQFLRSDHTLFGA